MFTSLEKDFLLYILNGELKQLNENKRIAETNDKRFTMESELNLVDSLYNKIIKL
jgi:hypothetical protein